MIGGPANGHLLALAKLTVDRDAGDASQRFSHVIIREFADVFSADGVNDRAGIAFYVDRIGQAATNTGDDHFLHLDLILRVHALNTAAGERRQITHRAA